MNWGKVLAEVGEERRRQVEVKGFTATHDDAYLRGTMARAAACYAVYLFPSLAIDTGTIVNRIWPWDWKWWKPKNQRRDLIRAAALIVAEIESMDRKAAQK